ncbi:Prefoldin subunit-domain-containing protein [Dunaliella salina]|uniref:Prefoldin subunit-domain-containing protein n=1 Tax=Dunaliella salina TaxID=3046 RepID=A0ABQ7G0S6_DUNSA|nr:Prefoldin subunit-domain-containing protein [Dunaliella salina]|eukprot:KAF5828211.1 Prefoldin subunit-domain-containing protein [Dunaliella salina]
MAQEKVVSLNALDPQQLLQLQERLQGDIEKFAQSLQFFGRSSGLYHAAGKAINGLTESKEGQPLLLPLTQSLYVSGSVASTDQVLVDIGTGYYVEMSSEQAQDYYKRKFDKLQEMMQGVNEVLKGKQSQLLQIKKALADRVQSMAAQQPSP